MFLLSSTIEKSPRLLAQSSASLFAFSDVRTSDYSTKKQDSQCFSVFEYSELSELTQKFLPKRKQAELLSASYARIGQLSKSSRVSDCGTFLEFAHAIENGEVSDVGHLHNANFCKDRLCPLCAWRRSYKIFAQVSQIMDIIGSQYEFLFLTLTVPSVRSEELSDTISSMMSGFASLRHKKSFKSAVRGYFRALEVTRNNDFNSKSYGLYHPHFHCVLAVDKSYFTSRFYISHSEWLDMWRSSFGDDSITQVDIRRARQKISLNPLENAMSSELSSSAISSAIAEIAKYSVKSSDYLIAENEALTDEIVSTLAFSLFNRRLTAYGGCFKIAYDKLGLDDVEDGDLVFTSDKINPNLAYMIVRYNWSAGAYKMFDFKIHNPGDDVPEPIDNLKILCNRLTWAKMGVSF